MTIHDTTMIIARRDAAKIVAEALPAGPYRLQATNTIAKATAAIAAADAANTTAVAVQAVINAAENGIGSAADADYRDAYLRRAQASVALAGLALAQAEALAATAPAPTE